MWRKDTLLWKRCLDQNSPELFQVFLYMVADRANQINLCKIAFRKQYPFCMENILRTNNPKMSEITKQRNIDVINN